MSKRPALPKTDPQMRRWCAVLEEEIATWPAVTSRPMFGLTAWYRGAHIFAALPRTRAAETPFSMLVKLPPSPGLRRPGPKVRGDRLKQASGPASTPRRKVRVAGAPGAGWVTFAMESEADIAEALACLARAYERAARRR